MVVKLGIYELWFAFRHQERSPHEVFIRMMEVKVDQMKHKVERERRREERERQFEMRTGKKLEEVEGSTGEPRASGLDILLRRYPSLMEDGPPMNNASTQHSPPLSVSISSPGGTERPLSTPNRNRFSIVRSREIPPTLDEQEVEGTSPDSFVLDMMPDGSRTRIVDRRRVHEKKAHLPDGGGREA